MAASAKALTLGKPNPTEEWTVVLPRRRKQKKDLLKSRNPSQEQTWVPVDLEVDRDRESKLMQKMLFCIKKIESSQFYSTFMNQIQTPEILSSICRVLGSDLKMQMVIYGIGSIESYESPRLQLGLAILMKKTFSWIGDVEVFDPILSVTESRVLEALDCAVLSLNEQGRREAIKPILFFMPHCEAELYDNLLEANWTLEKLNNIILLGNSFETYEQHASLFRTSITVNLRQHILAARKFTKEFKINTVSDDYYRAFHDLSWHSFILDSKSELQLV